ncbi:phosphopantetheine-binding protein [Streptomyces muensis]|uniref:Phosphopantetheine-binding protein n=1 Tax=Streptomyces muensis TaxID=1077944 RepID=A0A9X1PVJ6_STRM4|nr:phosphopantetheine-binding protein [Streptomyces muensis]MCF1593806.1 phosphopantetheine-binding protein [Streptomyces muensis]
MTNDNEFRNSMDALVVDSARTLTGNANINLDDDFFDAGGNSITAIRLARTLSEELGTGADVRVVFRNPVLRDLSEALGRQGGQAATGAGQA